MSPYTVSSISLAPVPHVHNGTGDQHDPTFATVIPGSVTGPGNLNFVGADVRVTAMLFARDLTARRYPQSGSNSGFHGASHHAENPDRIADYSKINRYHV